MISGKNKNGDEVLEGQQRYSGIITAELSILQYMNRIMPVGFECCLHSAVLIALDCLTSLFDAVLTIPEMQKCTCFVKCN